MEDIFEQDENAKNIYVIKHKLSDLKRPPYSSAFVWKIGFYTVTIYTDRTYSSDDCITQYEVVDVHLYEDIRKGDHVNTVSIKLTEDSRFKNFKPIMYNTVETPNGIINLSNGKEMPILFLCELIRYLYRLANLTAFL